MGRFYIRIQIFSGNEKIWEQRICDPTWQQAAGAKGWFPSLQVVESEVPAMLCDKTLDPPCWNPGSPGRDATFLCLSFLSYKMGISTIPTSEGSLGGIDEIKPVKWVSCHTYSANRVWRDHPKGILGRCPLKGWHQYVNGRQFLKGSQI